MKWLLVTLMFLGRIIPNIISFFYYNIIYDSGNRVYIGYQCMRGNKKQVHGIVKIIQLSLGAMEVSICYEYIFNYRLYKREWEM